MALAAGNQLRSSAACRLWAPALLRCPRGAAASRRGTAAASALHSSAPSGVHGGSPSSVRDQDRLQLNVEEKLGIPLDIYKAAGGLRVRQHVNPLKKELQVPTEPPAWSEVYADAGRPLVLDIGCGYGRFLLALNKKMPGHNMLGLEIREPIIERANKWAASLGVTRSVLFLRGNATITLDHTLASFSGTIDLVCVQFPDPHFKARHRKRHTVQRQLVEALGRLLAPGARVFLQSDVLEVAEYMRDSFEQHGAAWFAPCPQLHTPDAVFHAASEPRPAAAEQQAAQREQQQPAEPQGVAAEQQEAQPAWRSLWAAAGWLQNNPLGVPTEREVLTTAQEQPVYRVMLRRL
ncbi:tRNA (guanine-N(7)-)-methyltransferase [Micractinium conductrix]|uniref:tRNA (guanine(46)-N(7))-methyltransferase n=1 Tax=Micractinium conductrix TaxID=554055 RepID=A0A2P6V4X6_9CHLO|nr:tRNA (guanine-N(7)-)-methyltransferase [Micractinium conductrix]|eukprot:PSC69143.1 tRNA (guanine-N(7)-)-methyltransferase [Micractinium conductrix]